MKVVHVHSRKLLNRECEGKNENDPQSHYREKNTAGRVEKRSANRWGLPVYPEYRKEWLGLPGHPSKRLAEAEGDASVCPVQKTPLPLPPKPKGLLALSPGEMLLTLHPCVSVLYFS